jgi:hypothetical protein
VTDPKLTPPPELVQQWYQDADHQFAPYYVFMAHCAAQWGADQELLACGNYLKQCAQWEEEDVTEFYNYRRPKPPSLKEQALRRLDYVTAFGDDKDIIRRALEALPDD